MPAYTKVLPIIIGLLLTTIFLLVLTRKQGALYYFKSGKVYLGFLGVGVITVMDVLTSIFYAPGEAYRHLLSNALFFIITTAVLIALYAFSMTEISQILEKLDTKGGGVYNFSYLIFGRDVSLVAAASIIVTYVNTAAISSISAIENMSSLFPASHLLKIILELLIVWFITILNILGIKENVKITYSLFVFVCYVLGITIALGIANTTPQSVNTLGTYLQNSTSTLFLSNNLVGSLQLAIIGIGSTILAYSGIESVLQTQNLVENWKTVRKSYIFLVAFIGFVTPMVSVLLLTQVPNLSAHPNDLLTYYASILGGKWLSILVAITAVVTLAFAVNTSIVAGVELIMTIAERFKVNFLVRTNKFGSHYIIVLFFGLFFSFIILITQGSQQLVADMYAIGLVATFVLNLAGLIIFRFINGFSQVKEYKTNLIKNAFLLVIFFSSFMYLFLNKKHGALLWLGTSIFILAAGFIVTKYFKNPEFEMEGKFDKRADVLNYIAGVDRERINIYFVRPREEKEDEYKKNSVFISFGLLRMKPPIKILHNHFVLSATKVWGVISEIEALIEDITEKFPDKKFYVHLGWPRSSWFERLYMGIMVYQLMRLPDKFPAITFIIEYNPLMKERPSLLSTGKLPKKKEAV